jgi:hypothetical protein
MAKLEPEKGGRGKKSAANTTAKLGGFSMERVDRARQILRHSKAMALAMVYPEPKRGRGHQDAAREHLKGAETASFRRLQEARQILLGTIKKGPKPPHLGA